MRHFPSFFFCCDALSHTHTHTHLRHCVLLVSPLVLVHRYTKRIRTNLRTSAVCSVKHCGVTASFCFSFSQSSLFRAFTAKHTRRVATFPPRLFFIPSSSISSSLASFHLRITPPSPPPDLLSDAGQPLFYLSFLFIAVVAHCSAAYSLLFVRFFSCVCLSLSLLPPSPTHRHRHTSHSLTNIFFFTSLRCVAVLPFFISLRTRSSPCHPRKHIRRSLHHLASVCFFFIFEPFSSLLLSLSPVRACARVPCLTTHGPSRQHPHAHVSFCRPAFLRLLLRGLGRLGDRSEGMHMHTGAQGIQSDLIFYGGNSRKVVACTPAPSACLPHGPLLGHTAEVGERA